MVNVKQMVSSNDEDILLIHRFQAGEARAFDILVERYQQRVFNIIHYTMGQTVRDEDLAQDVFIKVFHALPTFQERSAFSTWLYRITVNACIDEVRRQKRSMFIHQENQDTLEPDNIEVENSEGIEEYVERKEMASIVHDAIARLPEPYRTVVTLRDINDLTYEEIAKILRCRIGTVKSRLFSARMKLRQMLLEYL